MLLVTSMLIVCSCQPCNHEGFEPCNLSSMNCILHHYCTTGMYSLCDIRWEPDLLWQSPLLPMITWVDPPGQEQVKWALGKQLAPCVHCNSVHKKLPNFNIHKDTYAAVRLSSGLSLLMAWRPFKRSVWTLQNAWMALPKWRPWWTKGSWEVLYEVKSRWSRRLSRKDGVWFFPGSHLQSTRARMLSSGGCQRASVRSGGRDRHWRGCMQMSTGNTGRETRTETELSWAISAFIAMKNGLTPVKT